MSNERKIIIGYGTGRCGTKSLARFLNQQPGFNVTHENVPLGWYPAFADIDTQFNHFLTTRNENVIGDIGFYWVHYVGLLLKRYHNVKVINLVRPDEEVVESFWAYMNPVDDPNITKLCKWNYYPYNSLDQTKGAIRHTITYYRFLESQLLKIYPACIYQMFTQELNDKSVLADLLSWIGEDGVHVLKPFHEHKRAEQQQQRQEHLQLIRNGCFVNRLRRRFGGVKNERTKVH